MLWIILAGCLLAAGAYMLATTHAVDRRLRRAMRRQWDVAARGMAQEPGAAGGAGGA